MDKSYLFLLLLATCSIPLTTAYHPYDPHDHESNPFFEGWFIRITSSSARGPASLAFGIGHLPDQHPSNPSAACFLIIPPHTDTLPGAVPNHPNHPPEAYHSSSSNTSHPYKLQVDLAAPSTGSTAVPRTFTHYFSSLDVHPSKQQILCVDCPAFVAAGANEGGSCRLEVTGDLVSIQAEIPGAFKFTASNDPSSATIVPWGDSSGSSPEGWLPAGLLKLHWYVYSMATPIAYSLTVYDSDVQEENAAAAVKQQQQQQRPRRRQQHQEEMKDTVAAESTAVTPQSALEFVPHFESKTSRQQQQTAAAQQEQQQRQQQYSSAQSAAVQYSGTGFAHMEKNWGDAFPEQWVWAQANSRDGKASFVLAGGSLPVKSPTLNTWISRLLTPRTRLNLPLLKLSLPKAQPTQTQRGESERSEPQSNTVQLNEPLAFAFSLHSRELNLTVDPYHPGWVTGFEPCACCSSLTVKLTSWGHEVVVRLESAAGSFAGLPCPTEDGFRFKTDESFVATAHVRVYGAAASGGSRTSLKDSISQDEPWQQQQQQQQRQRRLLLSTFSFDGAALEFGGALRCSSSSSGASLKQPLTT